MHGNYQVWTQGRIEQLISLWARGDSARLIGDAMGMSRNAILGKVHRLGLADRTTIERASKIVRSSVFESREIKPPLRLIGRKPSGFKAATSAITGGYLAVRKRPSVPELTKNELRAQLTLAVINTARAAR